MEQEIQKKISVFCGKFFPLRRKCLSSAHIVLINSPKVLLITNRDIYILYIKIYKSAAVQNWSVFETL